MIDDNYSVIQRGPTGTYYIVPRKSHDHRCVYAGKCISELDDAQEAAKLLQDINARWRGASPSQRNRLLLTILEAIYVYAERREIVGLRPRQAFLTLFDTVEDNDAVTLSSNPTGNFGRVGGDGGGHDPLFLTWPFNVRLRRSSLSQPNNTIGEAIKQSRAALGMSQTGLAARLGIDRKTVRSWERGDTIPVGRKIASLGECLQVDLAGLVL